MWPKSNVYKNTIARQNIPRLRAHLPEAGQELILKTGQSWECTGFEQPKPVNSSCTRRFVSEPLGYKAHEVILRVMECLLQASSQHAMTTSGNTVARILFTGATYLQRKSVLRRSRGKSFLWGHCLHPGWSLQPFIMNQEPISQMPQIPINTHVAASKLWGTSSLFSASCPFSCHNSCRI